MISPRSMVARGPRKRRPRPRPPASIAIAVLGLVAIVGAILVAAASRPAPAVAENVPVLAYYYIWYDRGSWDRAKTDLPLLGTYSSDWPRVMRQHIEWAKGAGIEGFIVSWKSTEKLDRRLQQLVEVASEENFKLAIIYQGLDFDRNPIAVSQIGRDLRKFAAEYATNPVFQILGRPLVIWSGTWKFDRRDIAEVTGDLGPAIQILASERDIDGVNRLGDIVDGNAYYWSSVNSETYPGYLDKLTAMSAVVHAHGGLWIAPVAAGFDARLVGGSRIIPRDDGDHLRRQMSVIRESHPDAIGLISWNEFSENSHVEPSEAHGFRYVDVVRESRPLAGLSAVAADSSEDPAAGDPGWIERVLALSMLVVVLILGVGATVRRAMVRQ